MCGVVEFGLAISLVIFDLPWPVRSAPSSLVATRNHVITCVEKLPNQNCEPLQRSQSALERSPISFELRQAQQEFTQFTAGIGEFHHEFYVHDKNDLGSDPIFVANLGQEVLNSQQFAQFVFDHFATKHSLVDMPRIQ